MASLFKDLEARGIVKQVTDPNLEQVLEKESVTLYAGFDPTSDSLHVGSLLPLLTLKRFQLAGHKIIAVVGGATGMIGDPSGKSQERSLLDFDQIEKNLAGISKVIGQFLKMDGDNPAIILNNAEWFRNFSFIDFLRDIGKHFTINHMMGKESVRARLEDREHGISYTEFSYMLLQAYDFYHLNLKNRCRLQIGGSDQWGNITAGAELIRRIRASQNESTSHHPIAILGDVYGMTHPLVTKSDGAKFGKSEKGNIWLDAARTSPYQFYQWLIQTADQDVIQLLKFFTFISIEEIGELEKSVQTSPEKRLAQTRLAEELTRLVHGEEEYQKALTASRALFDGDLKKIDSKTLLDVFSEAPSSQKPKSAFQSGVLLVDLLAETGLCSSKGAARKDLAGGGIYINNERASQDPNFKITEEQLLSGQFIVLRKGKKNYHLVSVI